MFKVNANGDSIWCKEYSYPVTGNTQVAWNGIYTFNITPENHILACGEVFYNGILPNNIWIFKTNEEGCIIPNCQSIGITEQNKTEAGVKIMPNPAKDYIIVNYSISEILTAEACIEIYDALGRMQSRTPISRQSGEELIDCSQMNNGSYLLILKNNGKTINKAKFVVTH